MRRRRKVSRRKSKKLFSRTATRTHKRNRISGLARGGVRL